MTSATTPAIAQHDLRVEHRFRLARAGILNVWQYDRQEFIASEGRLLLRGANGAGKSKTLEMLLPFVLDGDKARITASGRHHTSLLWLMTDGYAGTSRIGYLWVEFARSTPDGGSEHYTCGVGIRASTSAKTATAWFFTTSRRVGHGFDLEDEAGPLARQRLAELLGEDGHVFESARPYKEHVGRTLFGLDTEQFDEVLRLLYWLRQPQIGEDIEPARLAVQLAQALPQLDERTLRTTGETFDSLAAVGEELARRASAVDGLVRLSTAYAGYAGSVAGARGRGALAAHTTERAAGRTLHREQSRGARLVKRLGETDDDVRATKRALGEARARREELRDSREARDQRRLTELGEHARTADATATRSEAAAATEARRQLVVADRCEQEDRRVTDRLRGLVTTVRELDERLGEAGAQVALAVPPALDAPETAGSAGPGEEAERRAAAVADLAPAIDGARAAGRRRVEAVSMVRERVEALSRALERVARSEEQAATAEARWEETLAQRDEAQAGVDAAERAHVQDWTNWLADPAAVAVAPPAALDDDALGEALTRVRAVAASRDAALREQEAAQQVTLRELEARLDELTSRSAAIEAEQDPAPPAGVLHRTPRPDGAPLWRLVDFAEGLDDSERAGLEAALQDCGLLDAWVRPDGGVLGPDHLDAVLAEGPAVTGESLASLLRPEEGSHGGVSAQVLTALLSRVGISEVSPSSASPSFVSPSFVSPSGDWSLGVLRGRAGKERAQFVGASARAEERRRRLEVLREQMAQVSVERSEGAATLEQTRAAIAAARTWLAALPSDRALVTTRARVVALEDAVRRDGVAVGVAQRAAAEARLAAIGIREDLGRLAAEHDLPVDRIGLDAITQRLTALERDLVRLGDALVPQADGLRRLAALLVERSEAASSAEQAAAVAAAERETAARVAARHAELEANVGAEVHALVARVATLEEEVRDTEARLEEAQSTREHLLAEQAGAQRDLESARVAAEEATGRRVRCMREVGDLAEVPGLLESAFQGQPPPTMAVFVRAREADPGTDTPTDVREGVQLLADLTEASPGAVGSGGAGAGGVGAGGADGAEASTTSVWRAYNEATSSPAADHEPTIAVHGELLAVAARDDVGSAPIGQLTTRALAALSRDRALLTDREKEQFERHVLGELGEAIRRRRHEAEELVGAMNRLLAGVTTSQGIRVRLRWQLREDVPAEAKESVRLLVQPLGALLPEERARLRDSLHALIEVSHSERPELSYSEHLAAALDYREWFSFRIQYTRPESDGSWLDLHRRSPLSQGEQKVLCYLPLFAAAAAHFTSLAGAAPHAPRLVLLDDAFPKIDVRTHPLLFGLLVDLDLDFVITSERLWGDHDTVPALAIYEALRDPSERGIAQFEYRWDGRQLHAIG